MNLPTNAFPAAGATANPLPPSPPLALLVPQPSSSPSTSSVRIVIPSHHLPTQTLLQSPPLVTPPTAPSSTSVVMSTSLVSDPLAPRVRTDSSSASAFSLSNGVMETPASSTTTTSSNNINNNSTIVNVPVESTTTTATSMNDDDDDTFMMDIEIPNMLDDDDVDDTQEGSEDTTPSSLLILDHSNTLNPLSFSTTTSVTTATANTNTVSSTQNVALITGPMSHSGSAIDKEKIGRWTEHEHVVFLEGLRTHGKQWKVIATMIGTRTVVQVRTHAQKYFQKLDRNSGGAGSTSSSGSSHVKVATNTSVASISTTTANTPVPTHPSAAISITTTVATSIPDASQPLKVTTASTLLSPKSTILSPQSHPRTTYTKRKSLPSSLPSRNTSSSAGSGNPKKPRTNKMNPRLSMGHRGTSSTTTTATSNPPSTTLVVGTSNTELPSYPSYISKSSSSTGSDENWSTISPDNVIWDRVDFGNSASSEFALVSEDNYSHSALYGSSNTVDDDTHNPTNSNNAFDLLGEDPLEWLIETDCTQQYLPESSLPLFPFHTITSDHSNNSTMDDDDDKLHIHNAPNDVDGIMDATMLPSNNDDDNEVLLLRMTDPNVTVQSLFLPTSTNQ